MIVTPADALAAAADLLNENQEVLRTGPRSALNAEAELHLITVRAAQVEALSAWAAAHQGARHAR
jgi:hypothetical protein